MAGEDWEIFRKFLDNNLNVSDLIEVEKEYRKKLLEKGKSKEDFQNDSRMNFFAFVRNALFVKSLRKELNNLEKE